MQYFLQLKGDTVGRGIHCRDSHINNAKSCDIQQLSPNSGAFLLTEELSCSNRWLRMIVGIAGIDFLINPILHVRSCKSSLHSFWVMNLSHFIFADLFILFPKEYTLWTVGAVRFEVDDIWTASWSESPTSELTKSKRSFWNTMTHSRIKVAWSDGTKSSCTGFQTTTCDELRSRSSLAETRWPSLG